MKKKKLTIQHQAIPANPLKRLGKELCETPGLLSGISDFELRALNVLDEGFGGAFEVAADGVGLGVLCEPFTVGLEALDLLHSGAGVSERRAARGARGEGG